MLLRVRTSHGIEYSAQASGTSVGLTTSPDPHLHRFGCGSEYYSHDTEYYLCPFEVGEGETGVPEDQVRLDEVLVEIGDKLCRSTPTPQPG